MNLKYTYIKNLAAHVEIPKDGILSRTLYADEQLKAVLFALDAGQELSEHTASMPAILHIVQGSIKLTLGDDLKEAQANAWVHMPPNLQHSIYAKNQTIMLLLLLKQPKA